MPLKVYLSGEIHTDWREQIMEGAKTLDVIFTSPVTDHDASDDCGVAILGTEPNKFWHVVRFGDKYKQWNAAFDAGMAAGLGKSLIVLSPPEHQHALKEIHAAALAVAEKPGQVVEILRYVLTGELPGKDALAAE